MSSIFEQEIEHKITVSTYSATCLSLLFYIYQNTSYFSYIV